MSHFHAISTTDPMTGRDINDLFGKPYVVEGDHYNDLTIYFETEESKQAYLAIEVERNGGGGRLHSLLDNPAHDMNDYN